MTSGLNSISVFKFWSTYCPEIDNPFILLYVEWVFSGFKSLSLNILDNLAEELPADLVTEEILNGKLHFLYSVERVGRTLSQENFKRFWNNSDFVLLWYQGYNLKYIVYRKYFWVDRKSIFIGSVRPTRKTMISWITLTSKGKAYFSLQWITRYRKVP